MASVSGSHEELSELQKARAEIKELTDKAKAIEDQTTKAGQDEKVMLLRLQQLNLLEQQLVTLRQKEERLAAQPGGASSSGQAGAGTAAGPSSASAPSSGATPLELVKSLIMEHMWELRSASGNVEALYYDPDDNVDKIQSWLDYTYSMFITRPAAHAYGAPPLLLSGLINTGKSCLLKLVLPAIVKQHHALGLGGPDEACVLFLDWTYLPTSQGSDAMVRELLLMVVAAMRKAGMVTRDVETAEYVLQRGGGVSPSYVTEIFRNVPRPCVVLVDEVQRLLLPCKQPADPSAPDSIDLAAQKTLATLLKGLTCYSSPMCLWAVTGSSMANVWVEIAKMAPNGVAPLYYATSVHLSAVHRREALDHLQSFWQKGISANGLQDQLLWAENAAVLSYALQQWKAGMDGAQLQEAVTEKVVQETKSEWMGILTGLSDSQRRMFLSLAIATEGLDLAQVPQHLSGLRKMLEPLTKPVYPGSSRCIFQAAFHRGALQRLVDSSGAMLNMRTADSMRAWLPVVTADALLGLVEIGNTCKMLRNLDVEKLRGLLQEPAAMLLQRSPDPADWWKEAWFQEALFAQENQGWNAKGDVGSFEQIAAGAANAYKKALQAGPLQAEDHLAWFLQMVRNLVSHSGEVEVVSLESAGVKAIAQLADAAALNAAAGWEQARRERVLRIMADCPLFQPAVLVQERFRSMVEYIAEARAEAAAAAAQSAGQANTSASGSGRAGTSGSSSAGGATAAATGLARRAGAASSPPGMRRHMASFASAHNVGLAPVVPVVSKEAAVPGRRGALSAVCARPSQAACRPSRVSRPVAQAVAVRAPQPAGRVMRALPGARRLAVTLRP